MVKKASTKQTTMKSELSGEITSMPWDKFACDGKLSTAPMATMSPNAATNEQTTVEAVVSIGRLGGIAGDTPATTVPRLVVRPITRTMSAVNVTIASGAASLRRSR